MKEQAHTHTHMRTNTNNPQKHTPRQLSLGCTFIHTRKNKLCSFYAEKCEVFACAMKCNVPAVQCEGQCEMW